MQKDLKEHLEQSIGQSKAYRQTINNFLNREGVLPNRNIFSMFDNIKLSDVKVILIVPSVLRPFTGLPLSLEKYNSELYYDTLTKILWSIESEYYKSEFVDENKYFDFSMKEWQKQGVLILPQSLAVDTKATVNSEKYKVGMWSYLINKILDFISKEYPGKIYAVWDKDRIIGQTIKSIKNSPNNHYLESLDIGTSPIFNQINKILRETNGEDAAIKWYPKYEEQELLYADLFDSKNWY